MPIMGCLYFVLVVFSSPLHYDVTTKYIPYDTLNQLPTVFENMTVFLALLRSVGYCLHSDC